MSTPGQIEVSIAGEADAEAITSLFREYREHFGYTTGSMPVGEYVRYLIRHPSTDILIARSETEVLGFITVSLSISSVLLSPALNGVDFWVVPAMRGSRVAGLLLKEMQRYARERGALSMFCLVPTDRGDLQRFYRKFGWQARPLTFLRSLVPEQHPDLD